MRLEGKVAIVTGAGQRAGDGVGNGRATAIRFAREGAKVILANRSGGSVEETRDLIRAEGFEADCVVADVANETDCAKLVRLSLAKHRRLDIVHNSAGIVRTDAGSGSRPLRPHHAENRSQAAA